ncbi:MAG: hypothetical protein L3J24_10815 [Xanthomonadales bacterium]|nr:hypothetical protein [Xanthomonadales bacterium]
MEPQTLPKQVRKRIAYYYRLIASEPDFKDAKRSAEYCMNKHNEYEESGGDGDLLPLRAFYTTSIISYCRPFNSAGQSNVGKVVSLDFENINKDNRISLEVHEYILHCRNKMLAHTDVGELGLEPYVATDLPGGMVIPLSNDPLAPFTAEYTMKTLDHFAGVYEWCVQARYNLEQTVKQYLPKAPFLNE